MDCQNNFTTLVKLKVDDCSPDLGSSSIDHFHWNVSLYGQEPAHAHVGYYDKETLNHFGCVEVLFFTHFKEVSHSSY